MSSQVPINQPSHTQVRGASARVHHGASAGRLEDAADPQVWTELLPCRNEEEWVRPIEETSQGIPRFDLNNNSRTF